MESLDHTADISRGSSSEPLSSELSSLEINSQDFFMRSAKEGEQHPFTTRQILQKIVEHRLTALRRDQTRDQYITGKYCRRFYHELTRTLLIKIMPNPAHELAAESFKSLVSVKLHALNIDDEVWPYGSTTVTGGGWKKQADCCWAPASTNASLSLVVEVGLSESARRLALDAHGWLELQSSVKLVVTISIKSERPEIVFTRWELLPRIDGAITRASPASARRVVSLKLCRMNDTTSVTRESTMNGISTTSQLVIPFDKLVNRPPHHPTEKDLVITEEELKRLAERVWKEQGFL
ncbi:hypothetical protein P168DRAFT_295869 [Aspergillus campestris IBT 28561]|uniref:Uncharacterized protein n=1 Tax=Aspergillus campestris (strain IBT 28561) TaxID=1392248 RepID=A0A2I1D6B9_ASPC2|nr:uncharacterized protein P168DRAFT_295869 [Aspergillus campestris IBT 28561]PKY05409.1 hypothetical protein P168DRAFT_295869 [Aspergillus campestris IBT 28561]